MDLLAVRLSSAVGRLYIKETLMPPAICNCKINAVGRSTAVNLPRILQCLSFGSSQLVPRSLEKTFGVCLYGLAEGAQQCTKPVGSVKRLLFWLRTISRLAPRDTSCSSARVSGYCTAPKRPMSAAPVFRRTRKVGPLASWFCEKRASSVLSEP